MKLKIQIYGPRIHDADYRPWLTDAAINAGLDGLYASNRIDDMIHSILVLAEVDADSVMCFEKAVRGNRPLHANVSDLTKWFPADEVSKDIKTIKAELSLR